jgi:nucleotidyltransferase/DNA polymerase involved in DNA repair
MDRSILHVDMDAFFAAVEQRDHPEYRGKPVIVGADPRNGRGRGIVATCSYEARKFGIHSAQPISQAWKLCPQGIYVHPGMEKYVRASERIMAIFLDFTDMVEQVSIDEAFLDVTGSRRLFGEAPAIAKRIKDRVFREQCLTCSVGIARNKFIAKVASDLKKPDGLVVVDPGKEKEFLAPLQISRLWGVGGKTEAFLKNLGLERIGQLSEASRPDLIRRLGKTGEHLWQLANGLDDRPVSPEEGYQSIGHERTFERDSSDIELLHNSLLELSEMVAHRLRMHQARARTITVKFREADFTTCTRRTTLNAPADTSERIFPVAWKLILPLIRKGVLVRLIGVYASNLGTEGEGQLSLFAAVPPKDRKLAAALDDITSRYGDRAITRAALVPQHKAK